MVSLLTDLSSESVSSVLPLYLTTTIGLSVLGYGLLDAAVQGSQALVLVLAGWLADRGDHPRRVALSGYALSALTRAGLLVAGGAGALTALLALDRLGKGIRTAPRDAMIGAVSAPRTLARSFGVHRALDTAGAALGPLLAGAVLWVSPGDFSSVFVVSLACAVIGVAVLGLLVPDVRPRRAAWVERHRQRHGRGLPPCVGCTCDVPGLVPGVPSFSWAFLRLPGLRRLLAVAFILALLSVGDGFVYLVLQSRDGFAAAWFPLLYVGTNAVYMVLAVPVGRLADRAGRARVYVLGHLVLASAFAVAGSPFAGPTATVASLVLLGAFYAATDGVLSAVAGRMAPEAAASAIGAARTVVAVGRMVAAGGFGLLWVTVGRAPAMLVVAGLLVVAVPAAAILLGRDDAPGRGHRTTVRALTGHGD
ncbi:MFS transporter [Phycicoccus sp.]|uniref:MFS transporter n=1 Tax=Phycicoccus sp. TaxID=1902410 RepID=UPI002B51C3C6|nr:MFS transporter [Phycicoccus sp.]HMM97050.1 MFS transporter [Phycicoccus sp.]